MGNAKKYVVPRSVHRPQTRKIKKKEFNGTLSVNIATTDIAAALPPICLAIQLGWAFKIIR